MKIIIVLFFLIVLATSSAVALDQPLCSSPCTNNFNCQNSTTGGHPIQTTYPGGGAVGGSLYLLYFCDDAASTVNNTPAIHTNSNYLCSYIKYGGKLDHHNITNCYDSSLAAPINTGLIFLIIAGCCMGVYTLMKQGSISTV